jgi:hypothetical protein
VVASYQKVGGCQCPPVIQFASVDVAIVGDNEYATNDHYFNPRRIYGDGDEDQHSCGLLQVR